MRNALIWLLAVYVALHALYNWATPLGEGPDEPGHLAYVLFLAREGRLPIQRAAPEPSDVPGEGHQPPLAYALSVPAVAWLPPGERAILLTANPRFVWAGGDEPAAFMRGSRELWPWQGLTVAWHLARAVSGLCGALAVALTYLAARHLAPADPGLATLAAAIVALNPQLLFTSALVSNDALLAAFGAAVLWWCVRPPPRPLLWALGAGLLFGLALLTKQSALLLGPLLLWGGWRAAQARLRTCMYVTLAWSLTTALVAGWWFGRSWLLYGDPFGLGAFTAEFATQPFAWGEPVAWRGAFGQLFSSFWAYFGWLSVRPPGWTLWLYGALCALAALGVALRARQRRTDRLWAAPMLALAMACAWTLAFAAAAGLVAWQGRMLFPAIASAGVLLAAGLRSLVKALTGRSPQTSGQSALGSTSIVLGLLLLAVASYMPVKVIRSAYTWVALGPGQAQAALGNASYARYAASWEQGVVLRGWRLDRPARPGATLPLTLTWNSLEPIPRPWTVFVHLVDGQETIVAQANSQPRSGSLPFTLWTPGDWMADTQLVELPADLPPGDYRLRVGLYRPDKDGRRQQVWASDGSAVGDYAELGTVRVLTPAQP